MIAGILSRFGKIGVIIGFICGNVLLSYVANGNTAPIIYLKEIVVASLGLLLVPKNIQINIEDFFGKNLFLPVGSTYGLENNQDTIYKLNTVSETISEMSRTYKEDKISGKEGYSIDNSKSSFIAEMQNKLEGMQDNILYEDFVNDENGFADDMFELLVENENITKDDILKILEDKNEYVLGFEDFDTNLKIEEDIKDLARLANDTYKIGKVNSLWKQRINENKKVISDQLDGVSKAISNVAKSIKEKKDDFEEEAKEIKILCKQKEIEIIDVNIEKQKSGRFVVDIYSKTEEERDKTKDLEKIISKVLKEEIAFQKEIVVNEEKQILCKYIYISKDKFSIQIGIAHDKKKGSAVSGDYTEQTRLDDGKYLIVLSDGMGSGPEARKSSKIAVKMLTRMLSSRI